MFQLLCWAVEQKAGHISEQVHFYTALLTYDTSNFCFEVQLFCTTLCQFQFRVIAI